ncbi:MAG TPA: hypothetical protein VKH40_04655, partial [Alloacidobacterium sp.]|nr:hypothetical protein [Alloacidobacterium sp.]
LQDFGGQLEFAAIGLVAQLDVGFDGVEALVLQFVGFEFCHEADAAAFLLFVEKDAGAGFGDGFEREFELPAEILKQLGVHAVRLITNNPEKVEALESAGIRVVERISAAVEPEETFQRYLDVKREKMGHIHEELEEKIR